MTHKLESLTLAGAAGKLEALLERDDAAPARGRAILCHPNPQLGGTMHHKVMHVLATCFREHGVTCLRFNYRGVGRSEGVAGMGEGEVDDARVALAFVQKSAQSTEPLFIAGYSFGAWVGARLAAETLASAALLMIAPPLSFFDFAFVGALAVPKYVVQGERDTLCPPAELDAAWPKWAEPKTRVDIAGANHFFDASLKPLGEAVRNMLQTIDEKP